MIIEVLFSKDRSIKGAIQSAIAIPSDQRVELYIDRACKWIWQMMRPRAMRRGVGGGQVFSLARDLWVINALTKHISELTVHELSHLCIGYFEEEYAPSILELSEYL